MSHAADILKKIEDDRDGDFCDVTIASGPFRFAAHRVVVCAQSQVIRTACTGPWKEAASGVLEVKEWPAELARQLKAQYRHTETASSTRPRKFNRKVIVNPDPDAQQLAILRA
ncbi:hypothetical protein MY8738_001536 [Beauveria namnaoensis]